MHTMSTRNIIFHIIYVLYLAVRTVTFNLCFNLSFWIMYILLLTISLQSDAFSSKIWLFRVARAWTKFTFWNCFYSSYWRLYLICKLYSWILNKLIAGNLDFFISEPNIKRLWIYCNSFTSSQLTVFQRSTHRGNVSEFKWIFFKINAEILAIDFHLQLQRRRCIF